MSELKKPLRFITAASLFDGHDAAINIMRRIMQDKGIEVIHLGHNRSVDEVVSAAIEEDANAIAISSYQGGHVEYFKYVIDLLANSGRPDIQLFGGGGGVITPEEVVELKKYGINHLYSPDDGRSMGLQGMIDDMIGRTKRSKNQIFKPKPHELSKSNHKLLAQFITAIESDVLDSKINRQLEKLARENQQIPILGITGTGGAGKSSLTDEIIQRFRLYSNEPSIAIIAIDPSRRKTGGALLGDRIRMNALTGKNIFMRSIATRGSVCEVPAYTSSIINACKAASFDLIIIETPGIGQGDSEITRIVDLSLYVMTPEFGSPSQLEKIDMLDFADIVAINKFDRKGGLDAIRDVQKQFQRNRLDFNKKASEMPVFGTIASKFNDAGITSLYQYIIALISEKKLNKIKCNINQSNINIPELQDTIIPLDRQRYLAEISQIVRKYHDQINKQTKIARERQQLLASKSLLKDKSIEISELDELITQHEKKLNSQSKKLLKDWPIIQKDYSGETLRTKVRGEEIFCELTRPSLSGTPIPKISLPKFEDHGDILKWLMKDNLPGYFPFTAGVFPFKRTEEEPTRMFAGEGDAKCTNARFKYLSAHSKAKRLSTAFDSVTLYGFDPNKRPDIYGKIGNSGVSIATLEDMKELYDGFDLCDPSTSVSMTINGPAPTILAFFLNTAIEQKLDQFTANHRRSPNDKEELELRAWVHENIRGTVQADILKEDQGQNTCIFSTEFALKMMADIQEYFVKNNVKNFYSVSISGYHIAEAGANPITQLAFTLSNGFTYLETYLARGMKIDDFAKNLSFFFSNGMDPEYSVMGRVARRIWAVTLRDRYGANEISQKLKYHVQTSGRSLHAQEMNFNDIRTTLQALIGIYDNCNSMHTNAHDEAFTTPTENSVRRALAIQMIINREWGLTMNENPNQGSFIIDELTDLVEEAVLQEFDRLSERGGVLGAMETGYQRGKIQDESLFYETKKHDGSYPIIGVNTFVNPQKDIAVQPTKLSRSSEKEKNNQIKRLHKFQEKHNKISSVMLNRLKLTATRGENVFEVLVEATKYCSLGKITEALFEAGGQYRRSM